MSEALIMPPTGETAVKPAPTVYFIDDSATMREVIKIAFRRENINVITCADAASALAQFEQNRPDVVITDVIMPNQDGYAVCSQIKQHPEFGGIPVVLMSGVVNKSVADKAVAVKADELIRKPFQPQELIGRVRTLLAPKESAATQATRERAHSNALQSLFAPAPPAVAQVPASPAIISSASETTNEPAWPRALAEAFTPLLPPFSGNGAQQAQNQKTPQLAFTPQPSVPQTNQQSSSVPSSREMVMLRAEVARLELLVKKLQTELQLEREYNQALEKQIHTLINTN
ncbi:MAG TPA: response regulator [Methylomirabilota bacterium]|jgi:CheY-like chemotaxis protein|nr:response regulator [Methylomirabilota bacterium]